MSVYTRAGDKGKTHLYQGKVVSKANLRVDAIGTVDELNSILGIVTSQIKNEKFKIKNELQKVQNDLFEVGASLANPSSKLRKLSGRVNDFEKTIDNFEKKLPRLDNFILPGGGISGSNLHLARTVARRAERKIVELSEHDRIQNEMIIYLNRLSDLLFMMARFVNYREKRKEEVWKSR